MRSFPSFLYGSSSRNQTNSNSVTENTTPTVSLLPSENCPLKYFLKTLTGSISSSPPKFLLMACSTSGHLGSRRCSSAILYTIFTRLSNKNNIFYTSNYQSRSFKLGSYGIPTRAFIAWFTTSEFHQVNYPGLTLQINLYQTKSYLRADGIPSRNRGLNDDTLIYVVLPI